MRNKIFNFILKYYYIVIGLSLLFIFAINCILKAIPSEYSGYILLTSLISFTVFKDVNSKAKLKPFLFLAIPFLILIVVILISGNGL